MRTCRYYLRPKTGRTLLHANGRAVLPSFGACLKAGRQVDEDLPWHTTIGRTRQLYPVYLFGTLFIKVFALCVNSGMVSGHTQAVNSAQIKANSSMEIVVFKVPANSLGNHLKIQCYRLIFLLFYLNKT